MEENKDLNKDLAEVDNIEIEPLSDEDLESASGGCIQNSCSGSGCSSDAV